MIGREHPDESPVHIQSVVTAQTHTRNIDRGCSDGPVVDGDDVDVRQSAYQHADGTGHESGHSGYHDLVVPRCRSVDSVARRIEGSCRIPNGVPDGVPDSIQVVSEVHCTREWGRVLLLSRTLNQDVKVRILRVVEISVLQILDERHSVNRVPVTRN